MEAPEVAREFKGLETSLRDLPTLDLNTAAAIQKVSEDPIIYWGHLGIMENGSYYSILGIYRDN